MKRARLVALLLLISLSSACTELDAPTATESDQELTSKIARFEQGLAQLETATETIKAGVLALTAAHQNRPAKSPPGGKPNIVVPDDFATIQQAVDAAGPNSKIAVKSGSYTEDIVVVGKEELEIRAQGNVTVDGGFVVQASRHVTIKNFRVRTGLDIMGPEDPHPTGIFVVESEGIEILENDVSDIGVGIFFIWSLGGRINENTCNDNVVTGVYLNNADGVEVKENHASGNDVGILVVSSENASITENVSNNNINEDSIFDLYRSGIFLVNADNNVFEENTFNSQGIGILVLYSDGNVIGPENIASYNDDYGILLANSSSTDNVVEENKANCNGIGDIVDETSPASNTLVNNETGCSL